MNIRILTADDAAVYRNLRLQALSTNPEAFATTYDDYVARPLTQIASRLHPDDDHFTLGVFTDGGSGKLAGTVTLVREQSVKVRHIASVVAMYVSDDARRQGLGRALLTDLLQRTRQLHGLEQLRLCVVRDNVAAVALYQAVGFLMFGIEPNALKTAERSWDEVHMVLSLTGEAHLERQPVVGATKCFSHVTINVSDIHASLAFYVETLDMKLVHCSSRDAYLEWGDAWICLQERSELPLQERQLGVDHVALHIDQGEFHTAVNTLRAAGVPILRGPVERGGGWTVNFLDPDGTQLELHTGTLEERMKVWE